MVKDNSSPIAASMQLVKILRYHPNEESLFAEPFDTELPTSSSALDDTTLLEGMLGQLGNGMMEIIKMLRITHKDGTKFADLLLPSNCSLEMLNADHGLAELLLSCGLPPMVMENKVAELPHVDLESAATLRFNERRQIHNMLRLQGGNKAKTARALGISLNTLYARLHRYGMMASE